MSTPLLVTRLLLAVAFAGEPGEPSESSGALPSYDAAPVLEASKPGPKPDTDTPSSSVPESGNGALASGGVLVGGGGAMIISSIVLLGVEPRSSGLWTASLVVGGLGASAGTVLLIFGRSRRRRYREWAAAESDSAPARGNGMTASGALLLSAGAFSSVLGTVGLVLDSVGFGATGPSPLSISALSLGLGSTVVGAGLVIGGARQGKRFRAWRSEVGGGLARLQLSPSAGLLAGGAQLGLSGRF